jgi:hypothetical protein
MFCTCPLGYSDFELFLKTDMHHIVLDKKNISKNILEKIMALLRGENLFSFLGAFCHNGIFIFWNMTYIKKNNFIFQKGHFLIFGLKTPNKEETAKNKE